MDLAERLRRLGYAAPPRPAASPPAPRGGELAEVVEGEWREGPHGRCYVARAEYPLEHQHGGVPLVDLHGLRGGALRLLGGAGAPSELAVERTAFLDTETTGLAGGTGTYVFLVGLGYFTADCFVVEQFFMREYGEERALLTTLGERLRTFESLVTFNGKVFDWPLLQTRYAMVGQRPPLDSPFHLDLLFPARRVWRERLSSCCLSSLEENVLGVRRPLDVPSWFIPTLYFQYLRERDARPLRPVFAHNQQDLLSLLALTVRLGRHLDDPLGTTGEPLDLYALGRVFEGAQQWETAVGCYEEALARGLPQAARGAALSRLGLVYKRLARHAHAEQVWRSLLSRPDWPGVLPFVELAKHLEHGARSYGEAMAVVARAVGTVERRLLADPWQRPALERQRTELLHRQARLARKLAGAPPRAESAAWREERR